MKSKKDLKEAEEKAQFDAEGLEKAKESVGDKSKLYKATIEIQPPGLLHNSATGLIDDLEPKGGKKVKKGEDFKWEKASYVVDDRVCHPAWHIRSSIVNAAVEYQIPGKGKKTYKNPARAAIFVNPEFIPLRMDGQAVTEPTEIDLRPAVTARGQAKPTRRPLFAAGHRLTFLIYSYWNLVPGAVLRDILIKAGRIYGIGDYRPEFGRFEVVEFVMVDPSDEGRELEAILR